MFVFLTRSVSTGQLTMHDKFRVVFGYNLPSNFEFMCFFDSLHCFLYININAFFIVWTHGGAVRLDDWI
jgi:hypothetical protein